MSASLLRFFTFFRFPSFFRTHLAIRGAIVFTLGAAMLSAQNDDFEKAVERYRTKNYGDAQPIFEKIVADDPQNARAVFYLGALALRRDDLPEAVKQLELAAHLDPTSGRYQNELGNAYGMSAQHASLLSKLGLAKKCLAAYQRAVALEPDNISYRLSVMNYYVQAPRLAGGGIEKAYAAAEEVRARDPRQGGLAVVMLHIGQKRWPQAFAEMDILQRTHSDDLELAYTLARLSAVSAQQLDRGEKALLSYLSQPPKRGLPNHAQAHALLGEIREKAGDPEGAKSAYRAAVSLDAHFAAARQALERLESTR